MSAIPITRSSVENIIDKLYDMRPGEDVAVFIGNRPCGFFFIWDEVEQTHVAITPAFVRFALGDKVYLDRVML